MFRCESPILEFSLSSDSEDEMESDNDSASHMSDHENLSKRHKSENFAEQVNSLTFEKDDKNTVTNGESFNCSICLETVSKAAGKQLRDCLHVFCRYCLKVTIISSSCEVPIYCPFQDETSKCHNALQAQEIRDVCPEIDFEKNKQMLLDTINNNLNEFNENPSKDEQNQSVTSLSTQISNKSEQLLIAQTTAVNTSSGSSSQLVDFPESSSTASIKLTHSEANEALSPELNLRREKLLSSPVYTLTTTRKSVEPPFKMEDIAPKQHSFYKNVVKKNFMTLLKAEFMVLFKSLPPGIFVRSFEDRTDLLCAMIEGPSDTPYEGGLFFFDIQLLEDFPFSEPRFHFISFSPGMIQNYPGYDRLNPNLYQNGKVCLSLLGTWKGTGSEMWNPVCTLLQVLVSIQGLILVNEPYFNEPGFEDQKGTVDGQKESQIYNQMVLLRVLNSTNNLMADIPALFRKEVLAHFHNNGKKIFQNSMDLLSKDQNNNLSPESPVNGLNLSKFSYPLLPLEPEFFPPLIEFIEVYSSKIVWLLNEISIDF